VGYQQNGVSDRHRQPGGSRADDPGPGR
jgi:hypothetical protein